MIRNYFFIDISCLINLTNSLDCLFQGIQGSVLITTWTKEDARDSLACQLLNTMVCGLDSVL